MKKLLVLFLINLMLAVFFVSCGNDADTSTDSDTSKENYDKNEIYTKIDQSYDSEGDYAIGISGYLNSIVNDKKMTSELEGKNSFF